ncbi:helix-turn-helix domain-containing protein [Halorarum halophilum]|uniref:Helix-turn-helix domain-containing protein n=1 Tax=Halorarum halophilum TaxID=2743090 RepID=A0A7D5GBT2_9EURY|nr:helix-turn-helix domain-containing protein [Halobaculum halophilum]QLG27645.1 helix-turn-helix domain-containing protein [Halobaculum halophilum]
MPRATLKTKSNDGLVALSEAHPDAVFKVLGAWPDEEGLRLLVETDALGVDPLIETLGVISAVTGFEIRYGGSDRVLFEVTTTTPEPHGAMADSGIVPSFPLHLEDGWFVGDLVASQDQLSVFCDELDSAGIEYRITQVSATPAESPLLTDRQREVVDVALVHGYYDSPRDCTLTTLAEHLDVSKSAVSRVLHRAEGKIINAYRPAETDSRSPAN